MGGLLFGDLSRRYSKKEYDEAKSVLFQRLKEVLGYEHLFTDTVPLIDKADFGDMDIIITKNDFAALKIFNAQERLGLRNDDLLLVSIEGDLETNHPIYQNSYLFNDLHVDFIFVNEDSYQTAVHYTSYNDLGNFIGKIARELGVRFSYHGLEYHVYDGDDFAGKINLSKNMREILETLDLSWDTYNQGLRDRVDQAKFVVKSKFFNRDGFFKNLKSRDRTRIAKRDSFKWIIEYLEGDPNVGINSYSAEEKRAHILKCFPDFDLMVDKCISDYRESVEEDRRRREEAKKKFSNKLVAEYTGIPLKEVHKFMEFLSLRLERTHELTLKKFILQSSKTKDELRDWVMEELAQYPDRPKPSRRRP